MFRKILCILTSIIIIFQFSIPVKGVEGFYSAYIWSLSNYLRLLQAIIHYEDLLEKGGWPIIPQGSVLKLGDTGNRVGLLIERLRLSADFEVMDSIDTDTIISDYYLFDERLEEAVRKFQYRHGLTADGVVGARTIEELNVPIEKRLVQMRINLKRIRNLLEVVEAGFILINIPEFRLRIIDQGVELHNIKVIVGREDRQTPVFNDRISYLVFNPSWNIPKNKVIEDILPVLKEDTKYLEKRNIRVFENWEDGAAEINPENINWDNLNYEKFNYKFQQKPGPLNEMGIIKFMFPNDYFVYIHDTPHRYLFNYRERCFSSGCIRIEEPFILAEYCLKKNQQNLLELVEILETGKEYQIDFKEEIPVFIVYWTSWVSEQGILNFRKDLYMKDEILK
ncbi:MAG TPA: L,D-transpeptidase family protein [Halanaerobiales bacterium]|nr:L,D-transpeptidase family protein [Halanaerobiales bacterium]